MLTHKRCKGPCGLDKEIDNYHWKSKRRGTRQARCKDCMSAYGRLHYLANSDLYKDRANTRLTALRAQNRVSVKTYLSSVGCSRCEETNPRVLTTTVTSTEINNLSNEDLMVKLKESVVLCRNCKAKNN